MKKTFSTLLSIAMMTMTASPLFAQTTSQTPVSEETSVSSTASSQYKTFGYDGFHFDLPADCIVEANDHFTAKSQDGTYGVSITYKDAPGTNQKRAYNLVGGLAKQLNLQKAKLSKVKINGLGGAIAQGEIEGREATIVMLPYHGKEFTAILLNAPQRQGWTQQFLRTVAR